MSQGLLETFVIESREMLEEAGRCCLAIESQREDADTLNALFRAIHTIKGASGLFEIAPLTAMLHAAEEVLDRVRAGTLTLPPEAMDLLLACLDQVGYWLDDLANSGRLDAAAAATGEQFRQRLTALLGEAAAPEPEPTAPVSPVATAPPPWLSALPSPALYAPNAKSLWAVCYSPDEQCFFCGEDPLLTVLKTPGLCWFSTAPKASWPAPAELDPYRCALRFYLLASAERDTLERHFVYVADQVEFYPLSPAEATADWFDPILYEASRWELLQVQREAIAEAGEAELWPGRVRAVAAALTQLSADDAAVAAAAEQALTQGAAPLLALIDGILAANAPSLTASPEAASPEAASPEAASPAPTPARSERTSSILRVDAARIDALMDLVGELIVAKNALPYLAKRAEGEFQVRELSRAIKGQYAVINRLAEDLQGAVMQVRMVPVGSAFQRFPRLVRDLSQRLGKRIELKLEGEETEADKNIIEEMNEPLIHLVRNAIDHGLEPPEERLAAGKGEVGRVTLRAYHRDDRVVIEVADDGRGIDPQTIKRKAYERGLISEERLESIDDRDALQLIFAPGLSTAASVSDLSGRGVGMDAVRSAVLRTGGQVSVTSELGKGSRIQLILPLSMAVTRVMMVEVDGQSFGIPFEAVRETVRLPVAELRRIKHCEAVLLRGRLLPIYRLRRLLDLAAGAPKESVAILVVCVGGETLGLVVDEFLEGVDVVLKPLEGIIAAFPLYAGTALLGDGRVLLVLNLMEVLQWR